MKFKNSINVFYGIDSKGNYELIKEKQPDKEKQIMQEINNKWYYEVKKNDTLYKILQTFLDYSKLSEQQISNFLILAKKSNFSKNIKQKDIISFSIVDNNSLNIFINNNLYTLDTTNNQIITILTKEQWSSKNKELKEVSQNTSKELKNLLGNIWPIPEHLKKVYLLIDNLLKKQDFSDRSLNAQFKLINEWKRLLWPKYKYKDKEKEQITKIYNVIFLNFNSKKEKAVQTISAVFDDKNIPKSIKLKIANYLRKWVLQYMITDTPTLDDVDLSTCNNDLRNIYNNLKGYAWKKLSFEDSNKLLSYQKTLYSPKYKDNKNARILAEFISELMWDFIYIADIWKWIEISNELKKKYPNYNWGIVYTLPSDEK